MDGLKTINDTYGHMEGDVALKAFADVLLKAAGDIGMCFRVGGDEFTILASTGDEQELKGILRRIQEGMDEYNENSGKPYAISGSRGYAKFKKNEELSNCIRRADIDMYADKMARKRGRR